MIENLRLSFQSIWAHKMRSILTMLGIIIGIASIIAIVSTIQGSYEQNKKILIGAGTNNVEIQLTKNGSPHSISGSLDIPSGVPVVSDSVRDQILALDTVENVTAYTERKTVNRSVYYNNTEIALPTIRGIDTSYFSTTGYKIRSGRGFTEDDYTNFRNVVIVDDTIADNYFPGSDPIGETLSINGMVFTIIGVAAESKTYTAAISTVTEYNSQKSQNSTSNGCLFLPRACWPLLYCFDEPENVIVKASSTDDMIKAGSGAVQILNSTISSDLTDVTYTAQNLATQASWLEQLSSSSNTQLIWIASISLLVGGIGVMNVMMMTVTERTSEIGLKKAIGAKKRAILGQFLTESVVLTSLGGILGVGAGIGISYFIYNLSGIPVAISIPASVIAVAFSMLIGILFGLFPSMKAANLNPIEALRRE
ncbi:MAG: ABC transporter permease [Lachnospiraceae bacterium]|nr:ABC transporter permease [Lachnospiraceae bacterium]